MLLMLSHPILIYSIQDLIIEGPYPNELLASRRGTPWPSLRCITVSDTLASDAHRPLGLDTHSTGGMVLGKWLDRLPLLQRMEFVTQIRVSEERGLLRPFHLCSKRGNSRRSTLLWGSSLAHRKITPTLLQRRPYLMRVPHVSAQCL